MRMLALTTLLAGAACVAPHAAGDTAGEVPATRAAQGRGWEFEATPAWRDEFDRAGAPDPAKWGYDTGGDGWGNHELEYYTDRLDNASVRDGVLTITARKQATQGMRYSSARMVSKGKGDFLYGRFEVRAKLPAGRGTWPAIWMLPTDWAYGGWPDSGEIDIMEHVGFDQGRVHVTMHTKAYNHRINTQKTATRVIDGVSTAFHLYRIDWTPDAIRGYIDDALVLDFSNAGTGPNAWPFDRRFHFIMNVAVGGDWGGKQGVDDTIFPARMQVDYVRVYRLVENAGGRASTR